MSQPVVQVIGGTVGPDAAREGVTEAARRLSHALTEIANVLDVDGYTPTRQAVHQAVTKARGAVEAWGVA